MSASRKDGFYVFVGLVLTVLSGILLTAIAARAFSVEEFAALNWSLSMVLYLGVVAQLGGVQSSTVMASTSGSDFLKKALYLLTAVSIAVCVLCVGGLLFVKSNVMDLFVADNSQSEEIILLLLMWIPVAALMPVVAGFFRGVGRFDLSMYLSLIHI